MIIALLGLAIAQDGNWFENAFFGSGCTIQTYPGSPSGRLVDDALATNAALYSATDVIDHITLPGLARVAEANGGKGTVVTVRVDNLFSVQNVPARTFDQTVAGNGCRSPLVNAPVDLMSNRLAIAHQHGIWGVFYAVSVNGYGVHPNQTTRFTAPAMLFTVNSAYALAAPFLPAGETGGQRFNLVWDWVGGLTLSPGTVDLRAGYVGSQGFYTNVDERTSALFLRSVLQAPRTPQAIAALPYVAVGLQRLPWPEDLEARIGRTRIFGRQLRWYTLEPRTAPADTTPDEADDGRGGGFDLRTLHIDQMGLLDGLVDLRFTAAARPSPLVHEALIGVHTRGYDGFEAAERTGGAGIWLGMVQMPAARHYDVAPGPKPTLVLDVGAPIGDRYEARGYGHVGLRINHADLLDIHPYAVNAPQLFIEYLESDKSY